MPRREIAPIKRTHVWLFSDDLEWLRDTYGDKIGVNKAVRSIVRAFRQKVEAKAQAQIDNIPEPDINLNIEELADESTS